MINRNGFLDYYGKHKISPVHQNIDDLSVHYERRRKLYRQCGIPLIAFRGANILEVGPGSGYNTLALFKFLDIFSGDRSSEGYVDLVEPNPQGVEDMQYLFSKYSIKKSRYRIHSCQIENFSSERKYDFVFAEGFVQCLDNAKEIVQILAGLVKKNGILMFTCYDDVCMFIEAFKRLLGVFLTNGIDDYSLKEEKLVSAFGPQLKCLRGMSRPAKDWVQDVLLNPVMINGCNLSMAEAIETVGDAFNLIGASPQMFTDYSWYKDIWHDTQRSFGKQFHQKRMSLLMTGMPEIILPLEQVDDLMIDFTKIHVLEIEYEKSGNADILGQIQSILAEMAPKVTIFPREFILVFKEIQALLQETIDGEIHMDKYPHFFSAFGRTLQYVAFERRDKF